MCHLKRPHIIIKNTKQYMQICSNCEVFMSSTANAFSLYLILVTKDFCSFFVLGILEI